jgi:hypothetical protein
MPCQAAVVRPEDACSLVLLIGNRASVDGLPQFLRPVTPLGSQPPFGVGQSLHPYPSHYSTAFASSRSFTPWAIPRTYAWATRSASASREHNGLTTFRRLYTWTGLGRLCTPGETTRASGDRSHPPSLLPLPVWVWSR